MATVKGTVGVCEFYHIFLKPTWHAYLWATAAFSANGRSMIASEQFDLHFLIARGNQFLGPTWQS